MVDFHPKQERLVQEEEGVEGEEGSYQEELEGPSLVEEGVCFTLEVVGV